RRSCGARARRLPRCCRRCARRRPRLRGRGRRWRGRCAPSRCRWPDRSFHGFHRRSVACFNFLHRFTLQGLHHPADLLHADPAMKRLILILLSLIAADVLAQDIRLNAIATGLDQPVALTHAGDARLFITLQRGQIVIYDGTRILPTPFLDIRNVVLCCGERGLLSVAFHPQYASNGFFYVYYTRSDGDIVIARYRVSTDPNRADPASATILLTLEHSEFGNHNGGQLRSEEHT